MTHTKVLNIALVALVIAFIAGVVLGVSTTPSIVPAVKAQGVTCNATVVKVPLFTFPDGGNHTNDGSPRWTEYTTPGTHTYIRVASNSNGNSYFRAGGFLPNSWTQGTDVKIKLWLRSKNSTSDTISIRYYLNSTNIGDSQSWNLASSVTKWFTIYNTVTEVELHTIPGNSLAVGDLIDAAFQFNSIDASNYIDIVAVFLEVTVNY